MYILQNLSNNQYITKTVKEKYIGMKKTEVFLIFTFIIYLIFGSFCAFSAECDDVRQSSFRLHILANSDSQEDQELKLKVRDRIIAESHNIFTDTQSLDTVEKSAYENLDKIKKIAEDEIDKNGYDYPVSCSITNMYFETREYDNFTMPAGYYDALRIEIGQAKGHNWWCVMFPPMCLPAAEADSKDADLVKEYRQEHEVVNESPEYEVKFAILEFFQKLMA